MKSGVVAVLHHFEHAARRELRLVYFRLSEPTHFSKYRSFRTSLLLATSTKHKAQRRRQHAFRKFGSILCAYPQRTMASRAETRVAARCFGDGLKRKLLTRGFLCRPSWSRTVPTSGMYPHRILLTKHTLSNIPRQPLPGEVQAPPSG